MINIIAFREKKTIVSHISEEMTIAMCAMVGPLQCVSTALGVRGGRSGQHHRGRSDGTGRAR